MKPALAFCVKRQAYSRFIIFEVRVAIESFNVSLHEGGRFFKGHVPFTNCSFSGRSCALDEVGTVVLDVREDLRDCVTLNHVFKAVTAIGSDADMNCICIAEEIVKVT